MQRETLEKIQILIVDIVSAIGEELDYPFFDRSKRPLNFVKSNTCPKRNTTSTLLALENCQVGKTFNIQPLEKPSEQSRVALHLSGKKTFEKSYFTFFSANSLLLVLLPIGGMVFVFFTLEISRKTPHRVYPNENSILALASFVERCWKGILQNRLF